MTRPYRKRDTTRLAWLPNIPPRLANDELPDTGPSEAGAWRGASNGGLRLFLPESWTNDPARMRRARVPEDRQIFRSTPQFADEEIDRIRAADASAACWPMQALR